MLARKASSALHPKFPSNRLDLITSYFQINDTHVGTVHCQCCGIGSLTIGCKSDLSSLIVMNCHLSCEIKELGKGVSFIGRPVFV